MVTKARNLVFFYPSVHGTTNVINYHGSSDVNSFLHWFDIWGSYGHCVLCGDENHQKFEFECSSQFFNMLQSEDMNRAFRNMGVILTDNYEDIAHLETTEN